MPSFPSTSGRPVAPGEALPPSRRSGSPAFPAADVFAARQVRLRRMTQLNAWLTDDAALNELVDLFTAQQMRVCLKHRQRVAIVVSILMLVAGWALGSLATPIMIARLVGH